MTSFKPKTTKKLKCNPKTAVTLDLKHKEFLQEFANDEECVETYKLKIQRIKQQLEQDSETRTIDETLELKDRYEELKEAIQKTKLKKKEYLLDNSKYIFEYFEHKKNISMGGTSQAVTTKSTLVSNFFKQGGKTQGMDSNPLGKKEKPGHHGPNPNHNIVSKYLSNVSDEFIDIAHFVYQTDICQSCHRGEMIPVEDEGILVCNACSASIHYLIENEKPSYKEPPKEVCFYAYKRINHFKEILAQFQGKETTQIPKEVIENIRLQIKKERIEPSQITNLKTKDILKKLGYNKYYEHIPFINDKLGIKPPIMTQELEETLCNLFVELQAPYSKYCPDNRVNFLNYYYTAYKLCELLGKTEYLAFFPRLKDPEKRIEQDIIWKQICNELNWEFIPTL